MTQRTILFRANGGPQIGMGHLMRCLALAQTWQDQGGQGHFALGQITPGLERWLHEERFEVHHLATAQLGGIRDAGETAMLARQIEAAWVVVDGYHFDGAYQQALKRAGLRLLVVDDYGHAGRYYADLVLNQNTYADTSLYPDREPYSALLLGTQYALLRREFWPWRGWQREVAPVASKVLVTLGGADPANVTLRVIEGLQQTNLERLETVVVVGNSNPYWEMLQTSAQKAGLAIRLERNAANMPELMAWADVAVSAGGSTCLELAFLGVPAVVLVSAENQVRAAEGLAQAGMALNLGWFHQVPELTIGRSVTELVNSGERRRRMSRSGRGLVDGNGAHRAMEAVCSFGENE
jgi:UDP-2,4-diacetamido-2,4,6-trideoxy-beta-L-altropyranose hydrolase